MTAAIDGTGGRWDLRRLLLLQDEAHVYSNDHRRSKRPEAGGVPGNLFPDIDLRQFDWGGWSESEIQDAYTPRYPI